MSDLNDYNWHKTVGPAAGAPSSLGGFVGQQDHQRENQRLQGGHVARSSGTAGAPPRWLVTHPVRRGLCVLLASQAVMVAASYFNRKNDVVEFVSGAAILVGWFGLLWMLGGIISRFRKKA